MKKTLLLSLLMAALLTACVSGPAPRNEVAAYDLAGVTPLADTGVPLSVLDVQAPSWLDSRAMQYRRASEPARRQAFTESRWAATPAELLAVALRRQLAVGTGDGCRLKVELDEWVQIFDGNGQSQVQLALRASLRTGRSDGVIARHALSLSQAGGNQARQGVAAFIDLEKQVAEELSGWLRKLAGEQKGLVARCRA